MTEPVHIDMSSFTLAEIGKYLDLMSDGLPNYAAAALAYLPARGWKRADIDELTEADVTVVDDHPENHEAEVINVKTLTIRQHDLIRDLTKTKKVHRLVATVYAHYRGRYSLAEVKQLPFSRFEIVDVPTGPDPAELTDDDEVDLDTPTAAR